MIAVQVDLVMNAVEAEFDCSSASLPSMSSTRSTFTFWAILFSVSGFGAAFDVAVYVIGIIKRNGALRNFYRDGKWVG
jgi:hypothetical protein